MFHCLWFLCTIACGVIITVPPFVHTDLAFYSIPGYTLISDAYRISSHCGVAIYLNNDFSHERKFIRTTSTVFESVTIEIWKNDTIASKYLICSVYRPPTVLVDALTCFIDEFSGYLDDVQKIYRKEYMWIYQYKFIKNK